MSVLFRRAPARDWTAIDAENEAGLDIQQRASGSTDLVVLSDLWREANHLVGQRAPADRAPFLAYGYTAGRRDGIVDERMRLMSILDRLPCCAKTEKATKHQPGCWAGALSTFRGLLSIER